MATADSMLNSHTPLPQVTIQQLEYLVAAVDHETRALAAQHLGVTPSALSQGLAELERRLGLKLFQRVGRGRSLARQADVVLDYARLVLAETGDLGRWLDAARQGNTGGLRVGMIDAAAIGHYTDEVQRFRKAHPAVEFLLTVGPSRQLLTQMAADELDLVVVVRPPEQPPRTQMVDLIDEAVRVYAPPGIEAGPPDTWGPWLMFPASSHTREMTEEALRRLGARVEVVTESHQPEVLKEMVKLGLGWTALPIVQGEADPPLQPIDKEPLFSRTLVALKRTSSAASPVSDVFLGYLTD